VHLSWRGANYLLLFSTAITFASEGHLSAFAPLLLRDLGLSDAEVSVWSGLLFAVTMSTAVPLGPFWGVLAERFSRRAIILRSFVVMAAGMFIAAWAQDLAWVIVARAVMGLGFGTGGIIVATQAMLTPSQHVGRAIAIVQAAQPVASSLGPPLGAIAIPYLGLRGLFLIDGIILMVAAVCVAVLLPEPEGGQKPISVLGRIGEVSRLIYDAPPIRWSFVSQAFSRGAISVLDTYVPVRIAQVAADPAVAIGTILGAYGAATTLTAWLLSRFADRVNVIRLYSRSMWLGAALVVALAVSPSLWLVGVIAVLRAIPTAFSRPLLFMHLTRVVPSRYQTAVFGMLPTAGNFGGLVLPLIASGVAGFGIAAALAVGVVGHAISAISGARVKDAPATGAGPSEA
jgi:DHA1 family multidrug resistance protein-like MFS transporter